MKEIQLTRGHVAFVNDEDYDRVIAAGPWRALVPPRRYTTYAIRDIRKPDGRWTAQYLHRFILDVTDPKIEVDHRNHNGLDNQRSNIRECSRAQNAANRGKLRTGKSSRYRGVIWYKKSRKWCAKIKFNGKQIYLGYFSDETAAALAYDAAARKRFGEFVSCNFSPKKDAASETADGEAVSA